MRAALLLSSFLIAALPAAAADLTLRRVMLSSAGVGYIEYSADVTGPATLGLDVPLDQVDDVLKSLVVFDTAGGVGGIELPGRDDSLAAFGNVPFGPDALASPLAYLNSLRGVMLDIAGPRPMHGRLLSAETTHDSLGADRMIDRTRVTLLAEDGIRQFVLEEAESVQVADPALRTRVAQALAALHGDASHSSRHVTLRSAGAGSRTIRVGYVAPMALWKATYRLVLPAADGAPSRLQGWAVLENATGADWNGVQLALQYGNPVTFHQALYRSYFVQRPEVPVEILGRLLPNVDTRAMAMAEAAPASPPALRRDAAPKAAMAPAPMAMQDMAPPAEQAAAAEGAEDTVFSLATPVILAAGHTASVPILDRPVAAQRIYLVQANRPHPLAAVKLTNDTATSLPAGVLTLYDPRAAAAFAGDARLGGLPAGESRLLSFAEDLRTAVTWRSEQTPSLAAVTAARGVLTLDQRQRTSFRITLAAPPNEARDLLIEIPKTPGATLAIDQGATAAEETATAWRLSVKLQPGEKHDVTAHTDRITRQQTTLLQDLRVLTSVLGSDALSPPARTALQHLADLQTRDARAAAAIEALKTQLTDLERDETRLRQNLTAVPANDALHTRLVRQLETDETRIATLTTDLTQAKDTAAAAHKALEDAVLALVL